MVKKVCKKCGASSYSASEKGKWICPECGEDLTEEKAEIASVNRLE